jgi:hypothetical protein
MAQRGRPKLPEDKPPQRKFTKTYVNDDGVVTHWKYDLDKFPNGPISVDVNYPKDYFPEIPLVLYEDEPLTKRMFWNDKTEKYVGYQRAKQLGIVKT